ncbi:MAG: hypothetical protein ACRYF0_04235 [Janthinobacterium lividum]
MSIDTLTGDEFADLSPEEHDEALALYADAVSGQAKTLHALEPCTTAHEECLDKMARLLTLRKVHQVRRQEMEADEQFTTSRLASEQYAENARSPQLAS